MLLLAFETSAKAASVALMEEALLLGEVYQNTGMTHSQTLMIMAQDLLRQCGKRVEDVTHVAAAAGPGSFTGVRIGVAAAKGFAWGAQLPCCGVSTLEAMALGFGAWNGYVCSVMDARRAQVYNALFHVDKGKYHRVAPDRAISLADLGTELAALEEPIFLVGDGSILTFQTLSQELPNLVLPAHWKQHQRAVGVGLAAMEMLRRGEPCDGGVLVPNYLRLSQAERERLEREENKK